MLIARASPWLLETDSSSESGFDLGLWSIPHNVLFTISNINAHCPFTGQPNASSGVGGDVACDYWIPSFSMRGNKEMCLRLFLGYFDIIFRHQKHAKQNINRIRVFQTCFRVTLNNIFETQRKIGWRICAAGAVLCRFTAPLWQK